MATAMEKSVLNKGCDYFDEDTPMCEPCSVKGNQLPADRFCSDCHEYLCRTCSTHHVSQKALRNHVLLELDDVKKAPAKVQTDKCSVRCSEHAGKRIKYYCRDDSSFGCSVCFAMGHKQCSTPVYITSAAKDIANQEDYKTFDENLKSVETAYKAAIVDVAKMLQLVTADESQTKAALKDFRKQLNDALDQLEKDSTTKATTIKDEEINKLKTLSKELEASLGDVNALMKKTTDFLQTGKHCDVFVMVKQEESQVVKFKNDLEAMTRDKTCTRFEFRPNTAVLDVTTLGSLDTQTDAKLFFKRPDPVLIVSPETQKIRFILISKSCKQAIDVRMKSCNAKISWPSNDAKLPLTVKLECTLTQKTENCYMLAKEWGQKVQKEFEDFLKTISKIQNSVRKELWSDVIKSLQEITLDNPDAVAVFVEEDQGLVTVVGEQKSTEILSRELRQRIKPVEEKQIVKKHLTTLKPIHTKMLLAMHHPTKMEDKYKELKMEINQDKNEIMFVGSKPDVMAAKVCTQMMMNKFVVQVIKGISQQSLNMYEQKQVEKYINQKLKQQNVPAVWEVENNELIVCTASSDTLQAGVQIIRGAIRSTTTMKHFFLSGGYVAWNNMLQELQSKNPGKVVIIRLGLTVVITTTDDIHQDIVRAVNQFS